MLPLLHKVKDQYPEDSDILIIVSVVDSIEAAIQVFEVEKKSPEERPKESYFKMRL